MVSFFGCSTIISFVIGYIFACDWGKDSVDEKAIMAIVIVGMVFGLAASFWGGSFVKKEIIVEKYLISPMIFDGKLIAALMEEHDSPSIESSDDYIFQIKEGDKTKLIKRYLCKKDISFSLNGGEERRLEIKRSKTCRKNMWIWFFCDYGIIESKTVFRKGDSFLMLPRGYSL